MSKTIPEEPKAPATPATPSAESGELDADDLEKVAGGMKPNIVAPKKGGDPCDGGE